MKEYFLIKLSFRYKKNQIHDVFTYECDGTNLSESKTRQRQWIVNMVTDGYETLILKRTINKYMIKGDQYTFINSLSSLSKKVSGNIINLKSFISIYNKDHQEFRERFENLYGDHGVSKLMNNRDIDTYNSEDYIEQLIKKDYISISSVLVALIEFKSKSRKYINWKISRVVNYKIVDTYTGFLCIFLPMHSIYIAGKNSPSFVPQRLSANINSGYTVLGDWTDDRVKMHSILEKLLPLEMKTLVNSTIPKN